MNCNKSKCPHKALIAKMQDACASCTERNQCHPKICPHRALVKQARSACIDCDHLIPAGKGGTISADKAGERVIHKESAYIDRTPRGQVTTLPPEVEEKVADLFRRWCSLDAFDALLLLHITNGGTTKNFGDFLNRTLHNLAPLHPEREAFRATAWLHFQRLIRKFATFDKVRTWNDGAGGAVRREREANAMPLFDFGGVFA